MTPACGPADSPSRVVAEAIERHGGDRFQEMDVTFTFRGARFRVVHEGGRFHYERRYTDPAGREVRETLSNDGVAVELDGRSVSLDEAGRSRVATAVNSVVYFAFLPFRLEDPAVVLRDLDETTVAGEPYRKVEVTFREEGGGDDWEDRFVHWIHQDNRTLDYFAYRYHRDGGGTRFRRAVNRREVGGLLLQDYENYTGVEPVEDIGDYDRLLEADRLRLVSTVALEGLVVNGVPEMAGDEGFEIRLGIDRATYAPDAAVEVLLAVRNSTNRERRLSFATSQRYDLVLAGPDGEEVYRWSADRSFLQALGEESLDPGGELRWRESFSAPGRPGSYWLQGVITPLEGELSARLPLEVR